ncbi:hypothetical protein T492DRAFT_944382 [Pavlovales sp. CCMP2436]|nr:hypothetical protein T492DRAFT_944382 [Pavlovales sp. CCMP2436]
MLYQIEIHLRRRSSTEETFLFYKYIFTYAYKNTFIQNLHTRLQLAALLTYLYIYRRTGEMPHN